MKAGGSLLGEPRPRLRLVLEIRLVVTSCTSPIFLQAETRRTGEKTGGKRGRRGEEKNGEKCRREGRRRGEEKIGGD